MKKLLLIIAVLGFMGAGIVYAGKAVPPSPQLQTAIKNITDGKIIKVEEDLSGLSATYEIDIESPNQGVKEIEVTRKDFQLIEAEGHAVQGTRFNPGASLRSLSELAATLQKYPEFTPEKWSLEKNIKGQWIYEVEGREKGGEREYKFDATNLALLKTEKD